MQRPAPGSPIPTTLADATAAALDAYESLAALGEEIEDEWQYVQDLAETWRSRISDVADARGDEPLPAPRATAVARVCDEIALIEDPHRAIDWLSTFPQVVLVALGERP